MSWQQYVDASLVGTGHLDKALICNDLGNSIWAQTPSYSVSPSELASIVAAFKDPGTDGAKQIQTTGLVIAGEKFLIIKADDRSIYGKKDKSGIVIVKTVQAIMVAHYAEGTQPGSAANTVEQLGDYLIKAGY